MSFSDAVSQVDQILAMEQQLFTHPVSVTGTSGATGTGATAASDDTTSSGSSSASTFASALASAQSADDAGALSSSDDTDGTNSSDADDATAAGTGASSDLLSGGDSQLLTSLASAGSSSTNSTGATADTAGTTYSSSASALFSELESALQTSGVQTDSGVTGGTATSSSDPRIQAMTEEANALVGKPYVYGGGHDGWGAQKGYDCSGFVSAVLHAGGYLSTPQDTTTLPGASGMEAGAGQYVTVYDRDSTGKQGHVIIDIAGQFYESGGQHGSWGGGGGVQEISTPSAAYLATFNQVLHPEGL